ncbi:MAG: carbon-nitrogen hydrolase family protein [Chloroflexi bacterium]|nr:carbon-nitrogen hydrolase family protein [Chloroflexota bacterium]
MEDKVSIACVTFSTVWGDKAANLKKMKRYIEDAADKGNDIILFPELSLTGYECGEDVREGGCSMHHKLAETIPGPSTGEIAEIARKKGVYVVLGMPERDADDPETRYISAAVVGPEGVLGAYRKIHLMRPPFTESTCFTSGDSLPVFPTRFGPVGVQICFDFWTFPMLSRVLMLKGARIILNATASPSGPGKETFMVQQTCARGVENMVYTASANLTGKDRTKSFYGHSTIAGRGWKVTEIYAEGGPEEGIVSATLNMKLLEKLRAGSNLEEVDRIDVVIKELEELRKVKSAL